MGVLALVGVATVVGLLLQTTLFHLVPFGALRPDVLLILCVYLGLHRHSVGGSAGAFLLGYLMDTYSGYALGLHAFAMSLVFTLVYLLSRRLWMDNPMANFGLVFIAALLKAVTIGLLLSLVMAVDYPWGALATRVWVEAFAASLCAMPVFFLLDQARRRWGLD